MIDHDRLFKELLTTFFYEFLELFLPDVAAFVERDSITFLDKEIFTDVTSGRKYEADVVAQAKFRGEDAFFLLHVEAQSYPEEDFPRRIFRYFARLFDKYELKIYPIALFSFDEPLRPEPHIYSVDFPNKRVLHFDFDVIQLNTLEWSDFLSRPNPVASALMAKMKIAPEDRPIVKAECLRMMVNLGLDEARTQLLSGFVDTYLTLDTMEQTVFEERVAEFSPPEEERTMQIVTSWMQKGIEEGLKRGREEGKEEGRRALQGTLLKMTTKKFGELPEETEVQIRRLDQDQLDNLAEALLDFVQISDLEMWLQSASSAQN